ncbi:MAG: hypothetical protein CVU50_04110 [Candidatus Cloacimonetes bacterium HGW-Cloacimonetes-3]|jgi:hypothetical protein|nr:MAG: hypothetical protein CVU50_04110 [Candidatus Cloacimonetes bacterium HGW-Cloacimonetes-3]
MKQLNLQPGALNIEQIIINELALHPSCKLIDIYKLLFQAYFGPSHILKDKMTVAASIKTETLTMQHTYKPLFQDIGNGVGFCRISLGNLRPAAISNPLAFKQQCDALADLMQLSCLESDPPYTINELWHNYQKTILDICPANKEEWEEVSALAKNTTIPSHSDIFSTVYQPHYRIIDIQLIDKIPLHI